MFLRSLSVINTMSLLSFDLYLFYFIFFFELWEEEKTKKQNEKKKKRKTPDASFSWIKKTRNIYVLTFIFY